MYEKIIHASRHLGIRTAEFSKNANADILATKGETAAAATSTIYIYTRYTLSCARQKCSKKKNMKNTEEKGN